MIPFCLSTSHKIARSRGCTHLSSPGFDHELACQRLHWSRLQRPKDDALVQRVARHDLPVVEDAEAKRLALHYACIQTSERVRHDRQAAGNSEASPSTVRTLRKDRIAIPSNRQHCSISCYACKAYVTMSSLARTADSHVQQCAPGLTGRRWNMPSSCPAEEEALQPRKKIRTCV